MTTALGILVCGFILATAYEIGKYVGMRDAERIFRSK